MEAFYQGYQGIPFPRTPGPRAGSIHPKQNRAALEANHSTHQSLRRVVSKEIARKMVAAIRRVVNNTPWVVHFYNTEDHLSLTVDPKQDSEPNHHIPAETCDS
jgi:hypothetical protein